MSVIALVDRGASAELAHGDWEVFLAEALLDRWRPGEWDPQLLTFTGDPANPMTGISVCATPTCGTIVDGPNIARCQACRRRRATWSSSSDFDSTYRPRYRSERLTKSYVFTLDGLAPLVRDEVLYGLRCRDGDGYGLRPTSVRAVVAMLGDASSVLDVPDPQGPTLHQALLRSIQLQIRRLRAAHAGRDGTEGEVWDCAVVGLRSAPNRRYRAVSGHLDFTVVRQHWLRQVVLATVRAQRPSVAQARRSIQAAQIASLALAGRPHGDQSGLLSFADKFRPITKSTPQRQAR